ncbi:MULTISPECIES: cytochrome c [unclassified Cupriavidus]|uniref:c-type cytochrome n=1 Tax=unclassified Cupriavidus TaxID=2640874 RepID=UPI0010F9E60B|nr:MULTISPECIES: cytochrome c [unclassified Cupriavidus]MWL89952.1 c-type cytochrome [Cupriavidus sp. SW-Y-13]
MRGATNLTGALIVVCLGLPAGAIAADVQAGRAKALQCQTCHGMDGKSKLPEAPHLAGQVESYLVKSLKAYKTGARKDEMMNLMAKPLSDADIANLAAFYSSLKP